MPLIWIAAIGIAVVVILVVAIIAAFRRRKLSAGEIERARRMAINETGRLATGLVTEFKDDTVYFSYSVGGMEYLAAQDISPFRSDLPVEDDHLLVGPCSLKYLADNPANSIVICEGWSGLRPARRS